MRGKKGDKVSNLMIGLIILAVFAIVMLVLVKKTGGSVDNVLSGYIESVSSDYDGDGIKDFNDDSPCVSGQEVITAEDGRDYYYFGDPRDGSCDHFDTGDLDYEITLKKESSTGKQVCILEEEGCAKALKESYEKKRARENS
ncbi:MAG: hypothetical protein ACLFO2_00515 [Candidatus Woesearchaeota archaeon]